MTFFSILSKSAATARCRIRRNQPRRTLVDLSAIKCIRDRALDHVVEREKNLKPAINLKNLIISDPSKTLPLTTIAEKRRSLEILTRPIDFIRTYPSVFEEFLPDAAGVVPHVRLTPEAVELDSEEKLMYESDSYKQQVADRLVKLLMLNRNHKVPLSLVDRMKWDIGLPNDYLDSVVPQFPDYFHVVGSGDEQFLELVCWIDELAVSAIEKNAMKAENKGLYLGEYMKGMPIEFQVEYDFEMDKKYKKWLDNWQTLPYISPYQNASHLPSSSDESDKWAVGVLHELLHLLVPKKSEKENLLCFSEYMGLRPRIKRAMLQHPGIFYMSSKLGTHTIVLREAYKRNVLIDKHVLMNMRSQYIHLMNTSKHVAKQLNSDLTKQQQPARDVNSEDEQVKNDENSDSFYSSSSEGEDDDDESEVDDDIVDEYDEEDDDVEEEIQMKKQRGVKFINSNLEHEKPFKKHKGEKYTHTFSNRNDTNKHLENSKRIGNDRANNTRGRSSEGFNSSRSREQQMVRVTGDSKDGARTTSARSRKMSFQEGAERNRNFEVNLSGISEFDKRRPWQNKTERQTDVQSRQFMRSNSPRSRGKPVNRGAERDANIRSNSNSRRQFQDARRST